MNGYIELGVESTSEILRALSNEHRLRIMMWIMDPKKHFPPQQDGDLVEDGVCVGSITRKIGLTQPTVTSHMKVLTKAGLVAAKPIKNWVFYKPQRARFNATLTALKDMMG